MESALHPVKSCVIILCIATLMIGTISCFNVAFAEEPVSAGPTEPIIENSIATADSIYYDSNTQFPVQLNSNELFMNENTNLDLYNDSSLVPFESIDKPYIAQNPDTLFNSNVKSPYESSEVIDNADDKPNRNSKSNPGLDLSPTSSEDLLQMNKLAELTHHVQQQIIRLRESANREQQQQLMQLESTLVEMAKLNKVVATQFRYEKMAQLENKLKDEIPKLPAGATMFKGRLDGFMPPQVTIDPEVVKQEYKKRMKTESELMRIEREQNKFNRQLEVLLKLRQELWSKKTEIKYAVTTISGTAENADFNAKCVDEIESKIAQIDEEIGNMENQIDMLSEMKIELKSEFPESKLAPAASIHHERPVIGSTVN